MNFIAIVRSIIFTQLMDLLDRRTLGDLVPSGQRKSKCHSLYFLAPQQLAPPGASSKCRIWDLIPHLLGQNLHLTR